MPLVPAETNIPNIDLTGPLGESGNSHILAPVFIPVVVVALIFIAYIAIIVAVYSSYRHCHNM